MRFARIVFAWLLFCSAALAQVGQIPGWPPNKPSSGLPGPPTFTFQSSNVATVSNTTYALTTGTASATRFVVIAVYGYNGSGSGVTVSSALIDGTITPTFIPLYSQIVNGSNKFAGLFTATIPTGTSSSLVITWSSGQSGTFIGATYTGDTTTLSSLTPVTGTNVVTAVTTNSFNIAVANSGSVILAGDTSGTSTSGKNFTGSTPAITQDNSFNVTQVGHANSVAAQTATITTNWTGSDGDAAWAAVFR